MAKCRRTTVFLLSILFGAVSWIAGPAVWAAPGYSVCDTGCDFHTIQAAIDTVPLGAIITVADGTYDEHIDFHGKAITVRSANGPEVTSIGVDSPWSTPSRVTFTSSEDRSSVLDGFTVTGGDAEYGGGIYISGSSPTIRNCIISHNRAGWSGGGIYVDGGSPLIQETEIRNNVTTVNHGAGIALVDSGAVLENVRFEGNGANRRGGALYWDADSTPSLTNITAVNNLSRNDDGGALYGLATATVAGCALSGNSTLDGKGGALYFDGPSLTLEDCEISGNDATSRGGGLYVANGSVVLRRCTLSDNQASIEGGGWYGVMVPEAEVEDTTFSGNAVFQNGAGVALYRSSALFRRTRFEDNTASQYGGGLSATEDSHVTLSACVFEGNTAGGGGGGLSTLTSYLYLDNSVFQHNNAEAPLWDQGGGACTSRRPMPSRRTFRPSGGTPPSSGGAGSCSSPAGERFAIRSFGAIPPPSTARGSTFMRRIRLRSATRMCREDGAEPGT